MKNPAASLPDDFSQAAELYAIGRIEEAAELYRKILAQDEENVAARFNLGSCLSCLCRHEEAIEAYKAALIKNPLDVDILRHLGLAFLDAGALDEAEKCFSFCLAIDENCLRAHAPLANIHQLRGDRQKAIASYRKALMCPEDRAAAGHMLAALTGEKTKRAPDDYVEGFFDAYAASFEQSLLGIGYRVPHLLRKLLEKVQPEPARLNRVLDLGCGTGLSGAVFRDLADKLTGVDLAANMLREAKNKKVYDCLVQAELVDFLEKSNEFFDLVLLTDVLVYLGELRPLFHAVAARLAPGGQLLFSTELLEKGTDDYVLQSSGRYAHSQQYLNRLTGEVGLQIMAGKRVRVRQQQEGWIEGEIYVCATV